MDKNKKAARISSGLVFIVLD